MTALHPLAAIRQQGFDADLHQGRVRVWPRHKVKKSLALFVTAHLPEITQALVVESNEKLINNVLLWDLPASTRLAAGDQEDAMEGEIPNHLDGQFFAGVPGYRHV